MRRFFLLITTIVLLCAMAVSTSAQTCATQVTCQATVSSDESCAVTVSATFHLDTPVEEFYFPLPAQASNITLNGSRVGSTVSGDVRLVDLTGITGSMAGDFTVSISYQLRDVVSKDENEMLQLQLPLLSGFSYPVAKLGFTVTMPGAVTVKPSFSSGYHQANIEQDLVFSYTGNTVTGTSSQELKDHETLLMTLPVSEEVFPQTAINLEELDALYLSLVIAIVLGLVYWLIFLRAAPPRHLTVAAPPQGYNAGQLGSLISLRGTDLTAMIFSWAQLGYLTIHLGKGNRVVLYKRMEMGNERSPFEQRCFQTLFGKRDVMDTSGLRFIAVYQKLAGKTAGFQDIVHRHSGSKYVFRFFMAVAGLFDGICMGLTLGMEAAAPWLPAALLAAGCFIAGWLIQLWAESLFCRSRGRLVWALLLCTAWGVTGWFAGTLVLDIWIILLQLLAGLMSTFGGRRTDAGRQLMSEVLGFRRYLRSIPRTQLQYIRKQNPDYFHTLVPYALAFGCDKTFAKRFGRDKQPPCPYITGISKTPMTALQWSKLLRAAARSMEFRLRRQPLEKVTDFFSNLTR